MQAAEAAHIESFLPRTSTVADHYSRSSVPHDRGSKLVDDTIVYDSDSIFKVPSLDQPENVVSVWNPVGFDPREYLTAEQHRFADCARYIVHLIAYAAVFDCRYRDEFVPLKAAYLRRFFPGDDHYSRVRTQLIDRGVVLCDNHYVKGEKSFGYKLGPELSNVRLCKTAITDRTLSRKLRDNPSDWIKTPGGVHRHLLHYLRGVKIDYPAALTWLLEDAESHPSDEIAIQLIRDGGFFFHVCDYGRVHTNLTNLRSELRGFLSYQGPPLVNLDIRNSQPLIFSIPLRRRFEGQAMPPDVRLYVELVQEGRFYDYLMDKGGVPAERRSTFKRQFFGHVFFCKNWPETPAARTFGSLFPSVYRAVREMKAEDYAALAKSLQRDESGLMIGRVAVRCMEELPRSFIATIHDSIVTTPDQAEAVQSIMREEFDRIGLRPTIRIEELTPPATHDNCHRVAS
jgi:hypothetical protein